MPILNFYPEPTYRPDAGLPAARLVNMYLEKTPQGPGEAALVSRGGLGARIVVSTGPIRAIFRKPGADAANGPTGGVHDANDRIFVVSGGKFCKRRQKLCAVRNVTGEAARIAASDTQVVAVCEGRAYVYASGEAAFELNDTNFPGLPEDFPEVSDVAWLGYRFYYAAKNSDRIWFSEIGEAHAFADGLSFFTAEGQPDSVVGMEVLGDELFLFGESSIEPYHQTEDPRAPLARRSGARMDVGCAARATIVAMDNTLFWLGADRRVYRLDGYRPAKISTDHFLDEKIGDCRDLAGATAYPLIDNGHLFYVLNLPGVGSFAFDTTTRLWTQFSSKGEGRFRPSCGVVHQGEMWLGDYSTGQIWTLDPAITRDRDEQIVRVASCAYPKAAGRERCASLALECARGLAKPGKKEPAVEMRYSDDAGMSWSAWAERSMGKAGEFSHKAVWRNLGLVAAPGRAFEFRSASPFRVAFKYAVMNEPWP